MKYWSVIMMSKSEQVSGKKQSYKTLYILCLFLFDQLSTASQTNLFYLFFTETLLPIYAIIRISTYQIVSIDCTEHHGVSASRDRIANHWLLAVSLITGCKIWLTWKSFWKGLDQRINKTTRKIPLPFLLILSSLIHLLGYLFDNGYLHN